MTTSDHRHANDHRGTTNGQRSNNNPNQTNDVEIDSGKFDLKFFEFFLIKILYRIIGIRNSFK
jgi:hypothetical protein